MSAPWPLRRVLLLVGAIVAVASALGAGARADDVSRTTADEPQYLLSAISIAEDGDLNIRDELRARRYLDFHEAPLPQQTRPLEGGRRISPHDPLLPVVLAPAVAVGGWLGAKLALAALAGVLAAAVTWVAVRRFSVRPAVAGAVAVAFGVVPPLAAYGTQVYPELPAALAVTVAVGALLAPAGADGRVPRRALAVAALALAALPWLSVKYAPVVAALAAVAALRWWRAGQRAPIGVLAAVLVVDAAVFGLVHQAVYGGWTAYAAGDHFVGGELTVMGTAPDYAGRSVRLLGLLVDRSFGLAAWAPAFLLAVPALAALLRRRPPGTALLVVPLLAGWANATFVALTMHGWWWPGRQVVLVVPLVVLAVAWWVDRVAGARLPLVVATVAGLVSWWWLLAEVYGRRRQLIIDFADTSAPLYRLWSALLPDGRALGTADVVGFVAWAVVLAVLAVVGWRSVAPVAAMTSGDDPALRPSRSRPSAPTPIPQEHPCAPVS